TTRSGSGSSARRSHVASRARVAWVPECGGVSADNDEAIEIDGESDGGAGDDSDRAALAADPSDRGAAASRRDARRLDGAPPSDAESGLRAAATPYPTLCGGDREMARRAARDAVHGIDRASGREAA